MIYSLDGTVDILEQNLIVLSVNGVGYAVRTSMYTITKLAVGNKVKLLTYLNVREDTLELFGFLDDTELKSFKMLISISGVGPKAAISILSDLTPSEFAIAVASGDSKTLTKAQGIGLKTAQRIVLELKDKITNEQITDSLGNVSSFDVSNNLNTSEACNALMVLGYSKSEATSTICKLDKSLSVEDMIKQGLLILSRK